ncbi:heat shock protein 15 [Candidatus Photodesmus blepharus]|uniref:Heat shock protein 15 n=1 Tax=Candidatus Photodesmus blepharonis TaxID=1179155 RepID=A0A084CNJ4_9GAMM|nr:ribosome-associated heat shock protein Hsp15 [Candidatus Photodesmus blepharus]KEY91373.1 heat shock protein 15 [Candidatus Photodesmus blepharus]
MVSNTVRLDKWLWAARFYRTRTIARNMINSGKVHYNSQRSKASKTMEIGSIITLKQGNTEKTVVVKALSSQRRGAQEALTLYSEVFDNLAKRKNNSLQRKFHTYSSSNSERRPNKKQRRDIIRLKKCQ